MVDNDVFKLNDEQIALYSDWLSKAAAVCMDEELFLHAVEVRFAFCPLGRQVTAKMSGSAEELVIED